MYFKVVSKIHKLKHYQWESIIISLLIQKAINNKTLSKDIKFNKTIKQQDSIPPVTEEYKFFTSTHGTVTKKHIPGHKLNSNKL